MNEQTREIHVRRLARLLYMRSEYAEQLNELGERLLERAIVATCADLAMAPAPGRSEAQRSLRPGRRGS